MKKIPSDVSADVLIHNFGKKPNREVKAKIMDFIDAHKDETMKLTKDDLPSPEEEVRREHAKFEARMPDPLPDTRQKQRRENPDEGSSSGEGSPSS